MEDDHVDRPGVEVRQRMELTGTNRSIGLIALMIHVRQHNTQRPATATAVAHACRTQTIALRRSGGLSGVPQTRSHLELGR